MTSTRTRTCLVSAALVFQLAAAFSLTGTAEAITLGQVDDFEDGTVQGWSEGAVSPNPPVNIPGGGPLGAGDNYLENVSTGLPGAGGKMTQSNVTQWTGDYVAAGVTAIQMMAANFGATPLFLRIGVEGAATQFVSTSPVPLPADGIWYPVAFFIDSSEMTLIGGPATLNATLAGVTTLRITSQQSGPAWQGDSVAGVLGVDVISAGTRSGTGDSRAPFVKSLTNTPNPFRASTRIQYELEQATQVRMEILDVSGRSVRVIESALKSAGLHEATWDGRDEQGAELPAGLYFYRLNAGSVVRTGKVVRAGG